MGTTSKIQWTEATWNPWTGCHKVSPGCKFCYMYRDKERFKKDPNEVIKSSQKTFKSPLNWEQGKVIFTCSWSDFFVEEADEWRNEAWGIIKKTPHHTYQILTKRPERIIECLPDDWGVEGYPNVWIGVSVESHALMPRVVKLVNVPCKTRFISFEPLLGSIDVRPYKAVMEKIHWSIIGGESGNENGKYRYRECKLEWINNLITQLRTLTKSRIFVKQLGTHLSKSLNLKDRHGGDIEEFPNELQIRELPLTKKRTITIRVQDNTAFQIKTFVVFWIVEGEIHEQSFDVRHDERAYLSLPESVDKIYIKSTIFKTEVFQIKPGISSYIWTLTPNRVTPGEGQLFYQDPKRLTKMIREQQEEIKKLKKERAKA